VAGGQRKIKIMSYEAKFYPTRTAAELAAENPYIGEYEIAVESDTGRMKAGPGQYNGLNYTDDRTGSGGALTLATVTVDATVGTKQNLLAAVGASTNQIPTQFTVRNASQSLEPLSDGNGFTAGYNAQANDVLAGEGVSAITTSATSATFRPSTSSVGVEGDILGCIVDPVLYPSIVVAGAGTAAAIGTYTQRGTSDSKPFYNLVGEVDAISTSSITWETADTRWVIYDSLGDISYLSLDEVATPDLVTTWVNTAPAQGTLPVPTVTAGANPTFDVDVIYYDAAL